MFPPMSRKFSQADSIDKILQSVVIVKNRWTE